MGTLLTPILTLSLPLKGRGPMLTFAVYRL